MEINLRSNQQRAPVRRAITSRSLFIIVERNELVFPKHSRKMWKTREEYSVARAPRMLREEKEILGTCPAATRACLVAKMLPSW